MSGASKRWLPWLIPPLAVAMAISVHAWIDVPRGPMQPRPSASKGKAKGAKDNSKRSKRAPKTRKEASKTAKAASSSKVTARDLTSRQNPPDAAARTTERKSSSTPAPRRRASPPAATDESIANPAPPTRP